MTGRPNHEYIPNPDRPAPVRFTARDVLGYCVAVPLAALAVPTLFNTLDPVADFLGNFMPYGFAVIGSFIWIAFAVIALVCLIKALVNNIFEALGVRLKLGILNIFRR